jgi:hypothetical protein
MEFFAQRPDVPLLDRVKIQAEVLVPLVRGLEANLGKAAAHELVRGALAEYYRDMAAGLVAERGSLGAMDVIREFSSRGDAIDVEIRSTSSTSMAIDITGCRYAEFFQEIGEPELGFLLVCSADFPLTDGIPGVELERTQTIMQGAEYCDFRWRFLPEELQGPPVS